MNNRFIIIIGSRNNAQWIESNLGSVTSQDYPNYKIIYFDDASDDDTYNKANSFIKSKNLQDKFISVNVQQRMYKTWFYFNLEKFIDINDNDILVFLDGDDSFYCENVLSYLNDVYNKTNCWMTYGGMVVWEGGDVIKEPYPQNSVIPQEIISQKAYRKDTWRTSHLKTMRGFLWKKFNVWDLCPDGQFLVGPDDLAIMFSMLEMCPPEKVYRVTEPIYLYNHSKENDFSRAHIDQQEAKVDYESIIRNKPPYDTISFITPTLAGGLGNQMFEIAAAASLAKDNGAVLIVNNEEHILPNQGRNVNNYTNNIFSKIMFDKNLLIKNFHRRDLCTYEKIPYKENLKLLGHFQSWKYFDHNREYIRNLFSQPSKNAYDITAIQVRRGDYYKFPDHHPQLTPEYYAKAVKMADNKNILIFSDDIQWCIDNIHFGEDYNVRYMSKTNTSDWQELYTLSECKNIIISNSSFGWWSAYLNTHPDKKIYVPSIWFGKVMINEGFNIDDLVLPEWIKV